MSSEIITPAQNEAVQMQPTKTPGNGRSFGWISRKIKFPIISWPLS